MLVWASLVTLPQERTAKLNCFWLQLNLAMKAYPAEPFVIEVTGWGEKEWQYNAYGESYKM